MRNRRASDRRSVRIGLLGCGTVGQAVVRTLTGSAATIERATGHRLEVGPILVRDPSKERPGIDPALITTDPAAVIEDPSVTLVVEVMGGLDPTLDHLRTALRRGASVVTANKQLLSRHGPELLAMAEQAGGEMRFEASACGAVPVIKVLRESLLAAEVTAVTGIVNGTTNFILTEMAKGGGGYDEVLARAQALGYAEADPTEDVGGADAAAKMAILSSIAFHARVHLDDVPYEGIDRLQSEDIERAASLGFVVKLLGVARADDGSISVRVYPALVPRGHRLASVGGADNAVLIESRATREIMLVGPGAGGDETASAVVADVLAIVGTPQWSFLHNALVDSGRSVAPAGETTSAFYVRMSVADRPGVLARVASVFAEEGLSIRTVVQSGSGDEASLVLILHAGLERRMEAAMARVRALDDVRGEPVVLRVLGSGEGGS
ncbi:homoserine dehydrogenase [Miltoncostaea marina]|uniref:homoserine dehydrogenase n=1 Tax=Miltoncostaea marina TaxID=2843215 RepID=UPI001C3CB74C|nr:homoserine dehydrogenase [Miltoncostaea marina]